MNNRLQRKRNALFACALLLFVWIFSFQPAAAAQSAVPEYSAKRPENLLPEHLRAGSAVLIDAATGEVLFEKNAAATRYPASTTKIMTILLGILNGDMTRTVTMSQSAADIPEDSSAIPLAVGQEINFADLLNATMVSSGNDGSALIAEVIGGTQENFVSMMNQTAAELGCSSTHFANPHGYHDESHVTTARDLAIIARAAMGNETFRKMAALSSFTLPESNMGKAKKLRSHDRVFKVQQEDEELRQYYYDFATGIKTGFHSQAGYCYVGSATKNGVSLISVVLKDSSYNRAFLDTIRLMEYGFSQFITTSVTDMYRESPRVVDISMFALDDADGGRLELSLRKIDPTADDHLIGRAGGAQAQQREYARRTRFQFTHELEAPVSAGEVMGVMTYTPENGEPIEYEMLAARDIRRREALAPTLDEIRRFAETDPNPFPPFSLELAVLMLLPVLAVAGLSFLFYRLFTIERKPKIKNRAKRGRTRYFR